MTLVKRCIAAMTLPAVIACAQPYGKVESIPYDSTLGYQGTFDYFEPLGDSTRTGRPAIIAIHGGAWRGGDKAWGQGFAAELCPRGYVVFSVNYRLSNRENGDWPAQIQDVQRALLHIKANAARFRIDTARIASLGMSAGGHLATMLALRTDTARVKVAVNLDGEHDMTMPPDQVMDDFESIMTDVLGPPPWTEAALRDISTVSFARPDVSVLSVHGAGDDNVYVAQGERLTAALVGAGADAELVRIEGPDGDCHEDCWKVPVASDALHRFLDRTLRHDGAAFRAQRDSSSAPR